jgi:hypothetical protein
MGDLYVPDDLKVQMDAVGDKVNWSEVARPAFQAAVATLRHRKDRTMTTAIERLRASKAQLIQNDEMEGKIHGRQWAENKASYEELVKISKFDDFMKHLDSQSFTPAELIRQALGAGSLDDIDPVYLDRRRHEYLSAWIDGAQEFFKEVEDQL